MQTRTSESEWIEEHKYGKGSYLTWKARYNTMIFDEVHRCGGDTTLQSKLLIAAKRQAGRVICLSATAADDPRQMKALGFTLGLHNLNDKRTGFRPWLLVHGCAEEDYSGQIIYLPTDRQRIDAFTKLHEEIFPARGARMCRRDIPGFPHSKIDVKLLRTGAEEADKLMNEIQDLYRDLGTAAESDAHYTTRKRKLELLMVPDIVDFAEDLAVSTPVVIFVSFTETLQQIYSKLIHLYGQNKVGFIDGTQVGAQGVQTRQGYVDSMQANALTALVANIGAAGESLSLHDPAGQVGRATIITPCDSGRRLQQVFGRVDRAGGADSLQFLAYFAGTFQEEIAKRVLKKTDNLALLNDGDLSYETSRSKILPE
jgi:hypothetical protein